MDKDPARLAGQVAEPRAAFKAAGRDPSKLKIRISPAPVPGTSGTGDVLAALKSAAPLARSGVTARNRPPYRHCRGPADFPAFPDGIDGWRRRST